MVSNYVLENYYHKNISKLLADKCFNQSKMTHCTATHSPYSHSSIRFIYQVNIWIKYNKINK